MAYCLASDVRILTGITEGMLSDANIESLITFSDQQIDDDLGSFSAPVPTRVKHLSALLTSIKIYNRPDLRGGFSVGDVTISNQQVEEALNRWERDVGRIYAYYGMVVQEKPSVLMQA